MKFGAAILYGGKSRRMGRDKAELIVEGQTFLEHITAELRGLDELILSLDSVEKCPDTRYAAVADIYPNCGPMSGIHAALSTCDSDALLVVSCDLPLFRSELGNYLCSQLTEDTDAVVPVTSDGKIHPLCAVYRKRASSVFEKHLKAESYKILDAYRDMKVKYIAVDRTPCSEKWLKNINTPQEYDALCSRRSDANETNGNIGGSLFREDKQKMKISLEEAKELIRTRIRPLAPKRLPLFEALGCVTAETVKSQMDQPPFPRSPYDGYALRASDSTGASPENPVSLNIIGQSFAGKPAEKTVGIGEAVRIMTGGVIPDGADCVLQQEKTDEGEPTVRIYKALEPYENYCRQGEDFLEATAIVPCGIPVTAAVAGVAASAGCTELLVFPKPKIAVLSTGDELQTLGIPLEKGQIYSSNTPYLSGRISELHLSVVQNAHVRDNVAEIMSAFEAASINSDLVICTGGVSAGKKDLVPEALKSLGAKIIFHGVEIKPGMPAALALLKGKPILALSGNPFACAVTFELLARSAIVVLASNPLFEPVKLKAKLKDVYPKARSVRRFLRGMIKDGTVSISGEQGNGQLLTLIGSNCIAELPAGNEPLTAGTSVVTYMLEGSTYG